MSAIPLAAAPSLGLIDLVVARVQLAARGADPGSPERRDLERELAGAAGGNLRRLVDLFRLSPRESDLLQSCLALGAEPSLAAECERLTGRPYVTDGLVAALFGHRRGSVWNPGAPIAVWSLVQAHGVGPGEPDVLSIDPMVPAWISGELWLDRALVGLVRTQAGTIRLPSWPVDSTTSAIARGLSAGRPVRCVVSGEPGTGRTLFSAAAAGGARLPVLVVDTTDIADGEWLDVFMRLQRFAAVSHSALIWTGTNVLRPWPTALTPAPVHFVVVDSGPILRPVTQLLTVSVTLAEPTISERRWLWTSVVPAARGWGEAEVDALTTRYRVGAGDIVAIAANNPLTAAEAAAAARACRRTATDDVVQPMPCPYTWDDLILPPSVKAALEELAFEAEERETIAERPDASRLFPRELGLVALLAGQSGTGKTMSAQVIAAHLELDLLRVDLAAVMSKFIGETAKNLNRIFAIARHRQAVLLFDEADAHFSRRTEVKDSHDKYSNADTTHLLQLIEHHRGVVLLATNRPNDMDPAFVRRLRHVIDFPRPQAGERHALWLQAVAAVAPGDNEALGPALKDIAEAVDVTGAQIKNAVLSALFRARRERGALQVEHLIAGLDRELAKDGRPLTPKDRERWLQHA